MYRNAKVLAFSCYPSAALSCTHIPAHVYTHARSRVRMHAVTEPVGGMQMGTDEHNKRTKSSRSVCQRHSQTDSAAENKDPAVRAEASRNAEAETSV